MGIRRPTPKAFGLILIKIFYIQFKQSSSIMNFEKDKEEFNRLYKQKNFYTVLPSFFKLKSDKIEVLEQHYYLLKSEKKKDARRTIKLYFTFRENKKKTYLFLREKLKTETDKSIKKDILELLEDIRYRSLSELKNEYEELAKIENPTAIDFSKSLLLNNELDILEFHYSLLNKRENQHLYRTIRAAFGDRKNDMSVELFLLNKFKKEKNIDIKADILMILGNLRSKKVLPVIKERINDKEIKLQEMSLIVLGWVGKASDIKIFSDKIHNAAKEEIREMAVHAMRQLWYNNETKSLKKSIIKTLYSAIQNEKVHSVIKAIVFVAQEILSKNFGLKESQYNSNTGDFSKEKGDIQLARSKAMKALEKYAV